MAHLRTAPVELSGPLTVRHVKQTHDGRPIGFVEKLDEDNPMRGLHRRNAAFAAAHKKAMESKRGVAKQPGVVSAAQKRSATRKSK